MQTHKRRGICLILGAVSFLVTIISFAQEALFDQVSGYIEVGTVAVAYEGGAEILKQGRPATRENIEALARTTIVCVLPYDSRSAEEVIKRLPSLELIKQGLQNDKLLRQQRNEASDELAAADEVEVGRHAAVATPEGTE
jgi:hypothetical protein